MEDDSETCRAVFDALGVFKQDFDTAMQILMYQDEKVARLALEDKQESANRRSRRRGRRSGRVSPSSSSHRATKKRQRAQEWEENRPEPPASPFIALTPTQATHSQLLTTDSQWNTQQVSSYPFSGILPESQFMPSAALEEKTQETKDRTQEELVGDSQDSLGISASPPETQEHSSDSQTQASELKKHLESPNSVRRVTKSFTVSTDQHAIEDTSSTMPNLFQTAKGRSLTLSKAKVQAYEAKLCAEEDEGEAVAETAATVARFPTRNAACSDRVADSGLEDVAGAGAATMLSLFQTARGKSLTLSKDKVQAYEAKLCAKEDEGEMVAASAARCPSWKAVCSDRVVETSLKYVADAGAATIPSLFQTAKGRSLTLSKTKVRAYEAKLCAEEDEVTAVAKSVAPEARFQSRNADSSYCVVDVGPEDAADGGAATIPSLFQTAKGRSLTLSKAKVQAYEAILCAEEDEEKVTIESPASAARVPSQNAIFSNRVVDTGPEDIASGEAATTPSLFQTAMGRSLTLSKAKVRAYEAKLCAEEDKGKPTAESAASSVRSPTSNIAISDRVVGDNLEAVAEAAIMPSLFQTATGRSLTLSRAKVQAYEVKLCAEEDEEKAAAESAALVARGTTDCVDFSDRASDNCGGNVACLGALDEEKDLTVAGGLYAVAAGDEKRGSLNEKFPRQNMVKSLETSWGSAAAPKSSNKKTNFAHGRGKLVRRDHPVGSTRGFVPPRPRRVRELEGDKENMSPGKLVRQTTALEASKSWRASPLSSENAHPNQRMQHRPLKAKGLCKSLVCPSQERQSRKGFHPPVASKKRPSSASQYRDKSCYPASKKLKLGGGEVARPFVYREAMKISLTHLIGLQECDSSFCGAANEEPRIQVLNVITASNAVNVLFSRKDSSAVVQRHFDDPYDPTVFLGPHEMYCQLITGNHITAAVGATFEWFTNHYRWIVWKLAATERSFPRLLLNKYLTSDQVSRQICHRYQRDLNEAQRSVLKKILHRDASSLSCMVLCIAGVLPYPVRKEQPIDQELPPCWNMALVLTDGWYSVYAVPDAPLAAVLWKLHEKSSIVGTKIATWNASLQNSTEGIDPMECAVVRESQWKNPLLAKDELTQWPYLQLRYNSTRRVSFETQLGLEKLRLTAPIQNQVRRQESQLTFSLFKSVPLKSLEVGGGMVRSVRVKVTRISPVLHLQSKEWALGPRILCEEQLELYFQLRSEYSRMARNKQSRQDDKDDDFLVDREGGEDQIAIPLPMPFVKLDVVCTHPSLQRDKGTGTGVLTVWRPAEDLLAGGLRESGEYFASSLTVNWKIDGGHSQDAFLRLSSTKHTVFEKIEDDLSDSSTKLTHTKDSKSCVDIQQATADYRTNYENGLVRSERRSTIDVCVVVVLVTTRDIQDPTATTKRQAEVSLLDPAVKPKESRFVEHVFVTDRSHHLMSIRLSEMEVNMPVRNSATSSRRASSSSFTFRRGNKNVWKEGAIICLSGLEVSHYDEQLRVLDCVLVESTQIVSFPSKKSPFWDEFRLLQSEVKSPRPPEDVNHFVNKVAQLKRYVERDVLLLDSVPSQEHDSHVEAIEHEQLTQDLRTHEEESQKDPTIDTSSNRGHNHLRWDGAVVKVLPLVGTSRLMFPREVIAFASVNLRADDNAFRTVYLTRDALMTMKSLLHAAGIAKPTDGDMSLVQSVGQSINEVTAMPQSKANVFRFEMRQSTNERLINSWKPWEHLHASYWMALSVDAISPST